MSIAHTDAAVSSRLRVTSPAGTSSNVDDAAWMSRTIVLVLAVTVVRAFIGFGVGLSDTEAYYVQWARTPALSYYDHPPLVAWATWVVGHLTPLGAAPQLARVVPLFCAATFDLLLARLARRLFSARAGFYAVALVTGIPVFFFSGFLVNPEGLLAPLWTLFLLRLLDLRDRDEPWRPLAIGAVVGVAFLAKYTAVLALPVTLLHVTSSPSLRRWLRRPAFHASGVVALALATPVVVWNTRYGWPSLHLHLAERLALAPDESLAHAVARVAVGQFAFFQPLIVPVLLGLLVLAVVRARRDARYRFLAVASAPVLAFLFVMMVRAGDSEPHWPMMGYLPLVVVAAGVLDESTGALRVVAHAWVRTALGLSAAIAALYVVHARPTVLLRALPAYDPDADPVNETLGWDRVSGTIASHVMALGPRTVVAGAHNVLCGHVQAALDDTPAVYCASPRRTEYDFVGRRTPPADSPVVFVDSDRYPEDPARVLPDRACEAPELVRIERGGRTLGEYRVRDCLPVAGGGS
jgi:hypothetical protein